MSSVYVNVYTIEEADYAQNFRAFYEERGYTAKDTKISGSPCLELYGVEVQDNGAGFNNKILLIQTDTAFAEVLFYMSSNCKKTSTAFRPCLLKKEGGRK